MKPRTQRAAKVAVELLAVALLSVAAAELAVRVWFATQIGPSLLFYGTRWHRNWVEAPPAPEGDPLAGSPQKHANVVGDARPYTSGVTGYSKYFPHERKWTQRPDGGGALRVRINNHGFRGEDFTVEKPPNTIRILTLGASSTFGYHNRDDETYPHYLEQELQAAVGDSATIEVINFAIPHATTDNVLAMFRTEGLPLDPDVVTFYEGANDAATIEPREGWVGDRWREALVHESLLVAFLDRVFPSTDATDAAWWWSDEQAERRSRGFIANLEKLRAECRERGIALVVATQQFRSTLIPEEEQRGVTYRQEVELVRDKLRRGEIGPHALEVPEKTFELRTKAVDDTGMRTIAMLHPPRAMLVHTRLMDELRAWARAHDVPLVDVIAELDQRRDLMVNWVHLKPEANRIVASALAREIRPLLVRPREPTVGPALREEPHRAG
ncbi:MAG: SGNH/GDSL hydrolase family protein [Thermodesulfobacteriota bacterium]